MQTTEFDEPEMLHPMNRLLNAYGLNAIYYTTSVSKLVRQATSEDQLRDLVEAALRENPHCSMKLFGTVVPVRTLRELGCFFLAICHYEHVEVTPHDAEAFVYKLFVHDTWVGHARELAYLDLLLLDFPDARLATPEEDAKFGWDLVVPGRFAYQVKPESYLRFNMQDRMNWEKNERSSLLTLYVYYDANGVFSVPEMRTKPAEVVAGGG